MDFYGFHEPVLFQSSRVTTFEPMAFFLLFRPRIEKFRFRSIPRKYCSDDEKNTIQPRRSLGRSASPMSGKSSGRFGAEAAAAAGLPRSRSRAFVKIWHRSRSVVEIARRNLFFYFSRTIPNVRTRSHPDGGIIIAHVHRGSLRLGVFRKRWTTVTVLI